MMRFLGVQWDGDGASIDAVPRRPQTVGILGAVGALLLSLGLLTPAPDRVEPADCAYRSQSFSCDWSRPSEVGPAAASEATFVNARTQQLIRAVTVEHRLPDNADALRHIDLYDGVLSVAERQFVRDLTYLPVGAGGELPVEEAVSVFSRGGDPVQNYLRLAASAVARGHVMSDPFRPVGLGADAYRLARVEWEALETLIPALWAAQPQSVLSSVLGWWGRTQLVRIVLSLGALAGSGALTLRVLRRRRPIRVRVGSTHLDVDGMRFPWEQVAHVTPEAAAIRIVDWDGGEVVLRHPALVEPGPARALLVAADRFRAQQALGRAPSPEEQARLAALLTRIRAN